MSGCVNFEPWTDTKYELAQNREGRNRLAVMRWVSNDERRLVPFMMWRVAKPDGESILVLAPSADEACGQATCHFNIDETLLTATEEPFMVRGCSGRLF